MIRVLPIALCLVVAACSGADTAATSTAAPATTTTAATATTTTQSTATPTTQPVATTLAEAPTLDLEGLLVEFIGETDGGVVALAVRNGQTTEAAVGVADSSGKPLTSDMAFRVGSISKSFTATMVLQMVDQGLVDLDKPLGDYLPDTPIGSTATIRSLLSHQTGIANYTDQPAFFADVLADRARSLSTEEILAYVLDTETGTTDFSYSNTNYILLGQLVEHIDGRSLNDSLQARIAGPLGLETTAFAGRGIADPANLVAGWSPGALSGDADAEYESVASSAWAAGSLISSASDLLTFMSGLFDGQLISPDRLTEMTDVAATGYGFGLFEAYLGVDNPGYAHNGGIPGYSSTMGISPGSGDAIVILTNNDALIADLLAPRILMNW